MRRTTSFLIAAGCAASMLVACGGSSDVTCGSGTTMEGHECLGIDAPIASPIDAAADATLVTCGSGTHLSGTMCVPDVEACTTAIACPTATAGHASLCGRVFDLESAAGLDDAIAANGEPSQLVTVSAYDLDAFAASPTTATVLASVTPDTCGRFAIDNVTNPAGGVVAIVTDDSALAPDDHVATAIAITVSSGAVVTKTNAWMLRRATDQIWSNSAGLFGPTFGQRGTVIQLFVDPKQTAIYPFTGTPRASVTATRDGVTAVADDYYFSDVPALAHTMIAGSGTGADGTSLQLNGSGLQSYSGTGAEPASCTWPAKSGVATSSVAFVIEAVAVLSSNPTMTCQ